MWNDFYCAAAVTAGLLYIPGYLFWRAFRFSPMLALCSAPLYSAALYGVLPIAYYELGIPCNLVTVAAPALTIAVVAYILHRSRADEFEKPIAFHDSQLVIGSRRIPVDAIAPILYIGVGAALTYLLFIRNLPTPDAFISRYDNQTHYNTVRAFIDSNKWSSLHENAYLASPINAIPSQSNVGSFYPTGWHGLAALACDALSAEVMLGINATLVTICVLVIPLGAFAFMRALFPENPSVVLLGAIAAWSFPNWPWNCFVTGPLYPNLYGLGLMTATMAWVVTFIEERQLWGNVPAFVVAAVASMSALGLAHPNTVFSLYIFMACYGANVIGRAIRHSERVRGFVRWPLYVIALAAYIAVVVAAWVGFYHIPMIANVIGYVPATLADTIAWGDPLRAALAALISRKMYLAVSIVAAIGCIPVIRRTDTWPTLILPAAFFALAYVFIKIGLEQVTFWTAAPWYSDERRIALNIAVFGAPLLAVVFDLIVELPARFLGRRDDTAMSEATTARHFAASAPSPALKPQPTVASALCSGILLAGIVAAITVVGMRGINNKFAQRYNAEADHIYSVWESDFVDRAAEITGDALVLNSPNDGSLWAYGINGMNTYYRSIKMRDHAEEAVEIRKELDKYATNTDVKQAVEYTGAEYVLLLDKGIDYDDGLWLSQYHVEHVPSWAGIDAINDDTPGFEVVLAEGDDMRLYRIADAA